LTYNSFEAVSCSGIAFRDHGGLFESWGFARAPVDVRTLYGDDTRSIPLEIQFFRASATGPSGVELFGMFAGGGTYNLPPSFFVTTVPEPRTVVLLGLGLLAIACCSRMPVR